jgi:hypothetical protein
MLFNCGSNIHIIDCRLPLKQTQDSIVGYHFFDHVNIVFSGTSKKNHINLAIEIDNFSKKLFV